MQKIRSPPSSYLFFTNKYEEGERLFIRLSKNSFKTVNDSGKKTYYIKINQDYIEITEKIYKICKSSYDKIRYTYKQEVAHSVSHYEDMDMTTSFCLHKNVSAINKKNSYISKK